MSKVVSMFRKKIYITGLITLLTITWVFALDGLASTEWRNFEIVSSIFGLVFLYSILDMIINYIIRYNFLLQKVITCIAFILLYLGFGRVFNWYTKSTWYISFVYIIPIYVIWYIVELKDAKYDIKYINESIEERDRLK